MSTATLVIGVTGRILIHDTQLEILMSQMRFVRSEAEQLVELFRTFSAPCGPIERCQYGFRIVVSVDDKDRQHAIGLATGFLGYVERVTFARPV